jgi:2-(1,2-epoxy-1,2-dihydrophenyl)acetyl-CoA isomerase
MAYRFIRYDQQDGVARVTLDRPDVLNSFNLDMARELQDALARAGSDSTVRAVLLAATGRAFCAGQDLAAVPLDSDIQLPPLGETVRAQYNPIIQRLRGLPKPVVCAVNGIAAGAGASVAFACDIVLAASDATFVLSFCKIGLIPDSAATYFVPRLAGFGRAAGLMLLGGKFSAAEAREWGLIWETCEAGQLLARAAAVATTLATQPTAALRLTKEALNASLNNTLEAQLELEAELQTSAGRTADFLEGVRAFREKRKPVFRGE